MRNGHGDDQRGSGDAVTEDAGTRSGLARAMAVVELLAERAPEELGVSSVARALELPKAVAHRILKELVSAGFLGFDDRTKLYGLGPGALKVGLAALRSLDVTRITRPYLEQLVARTKETATLSARQGWTRVYVDQVLSPREIRMAVPLGTSHALHAGSSSKAILAALPDDKIDEYLAHHRLDPVTDTTITDVGGLKAELAKVREQGYAFSLGERQPGAGSVAAAVRGASGDVWGSISVCGPLDRFTPEARRSHGELLVEVAAAISLEIGYHEPHTAGVRR
jgi:IclR family transcriptional regulator, acetate operon repressor